MSDKMQIDVYMNSEGVLWAIIEDRYIDSQPHNNIFYFHGKVDTEFPHLKWVQKDWNLLDEKEPPVQPIENESSLSDFAEVCCWTHATDTRRMSFYILCTSCGNKRCPKATLCSNLCSSSNEPGQEGSRYDYVPESNE